MVLDVEWVGLDGVRVVFDDDCVVSDAGVALVAMLAGRFGVEGLVTRFVGFRRDLPGAANPGCKVMVLVFTMLLGDDSMRRLWCAANRPHTPIVGWLAAGKTVLITGANRTPPHPMVAHPSRALRPPRKTPSRDRETRDRPMRMEAVSLPFVDAVQ